MQQTMFNAQQCILVLFCLPGIWYCLVGGTAWWLKLSGGSYCLVDGTAWWLLLPCICYWLVAGTALWLVLPGGWYCLASGTAWWLKQPGCWHCMVAGTAWWLASLWEWCLVACTTLPAAPPDQSVNTNSHPSSHLPPLLPGYSLTTHYILYPRHYILVYPLTTHYPLPATMYYYTL